MDATSPAATCRTNIRCFTRLPPRLAHLPAYLAPHALIVWRKTLPLKERLGVGIERPDVEPQQCDIPARRLGPHGSDERGADALTAMRGAHPDLVQIDHFVGE